ncbi:MAG: efflux RND transporter periplasmic adaptor subunit [Saprospiraceae bacterium]
MKKKIWLWLFFVACLAAISWKLYSNKQALTAETELGKTTRAYVPVEVVQPQLDTLSEQLEADGIFLPAKEMFVISETAGKVLQVYKNKGDQVKEGDLIAKIDDELQRIELQATQTNLAKLRRDEERVKKLIAGEALPKNKIEEVQLGIAAAEAKIQGLRKQIGNTSIRATMTGTLGMRFIERGSVIGPGIQVAQITNLDKLFLMVKVTEKDILHVRKGQSVRITADVYPDTALTGKVTNIGLRADNAYNYDVEIEVANPTASPLRGGMHARAAFTAETTRQGLTIPRKAIAGSLQDAKVYVVKDSIAVLQPVVLGGMYGDRVEVTSGLQATDRVVLTGQLNLADGAKVQVMNLH